ncbi:MAG: hypothetical protein V9G18_13560 [Albidovulum sp.]
MSHEPRPPAVARPLALVVTGGRQEAVALEEALRRRFAAGLARLADDGTDNPRAALEALERDAREVLERGGGEALEGCARAAVARYNGRNDRTPDRAIRDDDEV